MREKKSSEESEESEGSEEGEAESKIQQSKTLEGPIYTLHRQTLSALQSHFKFQVGKLEVVIE